MLERNTAPARLNQQGEMRKVMPKIDVIGEEWPLDSL